MTGAEQAERVTPDSIMRLGLGFWGSKTLLSAVELRLFGTLSQAGPLTAEQLREQLGLHPRGARDFFDALVALGMLERDDDGRHSILRRPNSSSTRPSLRISAACWR